MKLCYIILFLGELKIVKILSISIKKNIWSDLLFRYRYKGIIVLTQKFTLTPVDNYKLTNKASLKKASCIFIT